MSRILRRAAAVAAAALLPAAVLVPTAHADIATFPDVGAHITSVRVSHGPATVGVTAFDADMEFTPSTSSGWTPTPATPVPSTGSTSCPTPRSSR